jgi:hypothetical protein
MHVFAVPSNVPDGAIERDKRSCRCAKAVLEVATCLPIETRDELVDIHRDRYREW